MNFPSGAIQAHRPNSARPYGIPWANVSRWEPAFTNAGAEFGVDPALIAAMAVIESDANQYRGGKTTGARSDVIVRDDGFGDGLSVGMLQPKPGIWQSLAPDADAYTPAGNIRLGAAIMASAITQRGSWEQAIRLTYFPANDPNGTTQNAYVETVRSLMKEMQPVVDPTVDQWRPYPYPPTRDMLVKKPAEGAGFDRVAFRRPRIVGSANHITDGVPGGDQCVWYRDFFSTGGERAWDALTDTVIATNGDIGVLNDWRDPSRGGTRAGWANGTATGLEGPGIEFYRRYPLINDVLVSKEHVTVTGRALTTSQMAASIEFSTAVAQEAKCPWDTYPNHPGKQNVNIETMHFWFAPKACPAEPFISTHYPTLIKEVRARLKAHQGGEPSPPPPETPRFTIYGMTETQLAWFFGEMTKVNDDGSREQLPFSPTGPLSLLWMSRCEAEGVFPEAEYMESFDSKIDIAGREWYAVWRNGWTAWLPITNDRAGWRWLEPKAA